MEIWPLLVTLITSLGGGTWIGHYLARNKTEAETESINLKNAELIRMEWERLYKELNEKVNRMGVKIESLEKELSNEKDKVNSMERKLLKYESLEDYKREE